MTRINIYASELATLIGINPYQKIKDSLLKLWQKCDEEDYERTLDYIEQTKQIKFEVKQDDIENVKKIAFESGINMNKINECLNTANTSELLQKRNELLKESQSQITNPQKMVEFKKTLESATNKNFGTKNESNVMELYKQKTGKNVLTPSKYVNKKLCSYNGRDWYIGGKIDGITDDNIVIEIKNRMYRLFNSMKDYEKPQLQSYLYILGPTKGHLVECVKGRNGSNINIIEEQFDEEYWNNFVLYRLNNFIKIYNIFLNDIQMKTFVLLGDENEVNQTLLQFVIQ